MTLLEGREKAREAERRYRERHPERLKEQQARKDKVKKAKYKDSPEFRARAVARAKIWYENNKERALENKRRYEKRNAAVIKAKARTKWLKRYGLTELLWIEKFKAQGSVCGCCGTDDPKGKWQTDHCWKTDKLRSIVCVPCNTAVANHSPEFLRNAADYVEKWALTHAKI